MMDSTHSDFNKIRTYLWKKGKNHTKEATYSGFLLSCPKTVKDIKDQLLGAMECVKVKVLVTH